MTKLTLLTAIIALAAVHGHCQERAHPIAFEVASITPCKAGTPAPPGEHAGMADFIAPGGRFHAQATTVKFLLEWAYGIVPAEHSGGPSWMENDRYDILAKAEGNPSDADVKRMAQTLLADRFKLRFHREAREISVLLVSAGAAPPKMLPPKEAETHGIRVVHQTDQDQTTVGYHVVATRFTLADLNQVFARQIGRVIVDETGLKGEFDFAFDLVPDETQPNPLDASLLVGAMREQLGLTVKSAKRPVDVMVIDNLEKVAAGNGPN